ncbi:type 2 periplasmic-binding domain-containing protein [Teredinibacter purpureus]|uniref:diguanylate cyclase n=1 Tax=Teredinibacter purpureus TaxID=2731756 RepID=UPI0005F7DD07|nr:diguanylate cyclase [Teredinibacter purpureus]
MNDRKSWCWLLVVCLLLPVLSNAETTIYHQKQSLPNDVYMIGLLKLALSYSEEDHTFIESTDSITRARLARMVETGDLSLMWSGASIEKESTYVPVRIPTYKGLMGYRIFIIREGDQPRFDSVRSLDDLRQLKMGQGKTWSDTAILQSGGMNVVTTLKAPGLYPMLEGGRFDAFPRGVHEPWQEVASRPGMNLTVEKNIVVKYTMPYYFYVSPSHAVLAGRIAAGLEEAIDDGSFDDYFFNAPEVKKALARSNLANRRMYTIPNPHLSPQTPVDRSELWLNLEYIKHVISP